MRLLAMMMMMIWLIWSDCLDAWTRPAAGRGLARSKEGKLFYLESVCCTLYGSHVPVHGHVRPSSLASLSSSSSAKSAFWGNFLSLVIGQVNVLMRECWQTDPSQRPSFHQVLFMVIIIMIVVMMIIIVMIVKLSWQNDHHRLLSCLVPIWANWRDKLMNPERDLTQGLGPNFSGLWLPWSLLGGGLWGLLGHDLHQGLHTLNLRNGKQVFNKVSIPCKTLASIARISHI